MTNKTIDINKVFLQEELNDLLCDDLIDGELSPSTYIELEEFINKALSQAHSEGVKKERQRIVKMVGKIEKHEFFPMGGTGKDGKIYVLLADIINSVEGKT